MAGTSRYLEIDDLLGIGTVIQPRISPDGRWASYLLRRPVLEENRNDLAVMLVPTAGGDTVRVSPERVPVSPPQWRPGVGQVTWIGPDDKGRPQVFACDPASRRTEPLTALAQPVAGFAWSPDGQCLALILRDVAADDPWWKGIRKPWVIDRRQFKMDGAGYLDRLRTHLYVLELKGGGLRQITDGDYDDSMPAWSPDGTRIAFCSNRTPDPDANGCIDVWVVAADGADRSLRKVSTSDDMDMMPVWSPDGRHIAWVTYAEPQYFYFSLRKIALHDCDSGQTRLLPADLDRSVHAPAFSPDGRYLHYLYEDEGKMDLARTPVAGGAQELLTNGSRWVFGFSVATDGTTLVQMGDWSEAGEYFSAGNVYLLDGAVPRKLTRHNDETFAGIELNQPEEIWYESTDGVRVQAFLFKPPGFDPEKKYPLVMDCHGGPIMQFGYRFEGMAQMLAAQGYLVLTPNIRGSSGRGRDFQLGVWRDFGGQEIEDVVAAIRHLAARSYIDTSRLAIQGWSHGGGVTNQAITQHPQLFAAAISGAGQSFRFGDYGHDMYQAASPKMLGQPWENRDEWDKRAPFLSVTRIRTPTMFVTGEHDWNVTATNSERMYQALKALGRETLLVVYPGEAHVIQAPKYERHRLQMYRDWYRKYLG